MTSLHSSWSSQSFKSRTNYLFLYQTFDGKAQPQKINGSPGPYLANNGDGTFFLLRARKGSSAARGLVARVLFSILFLLVSA